MLNPNKQLKEAGKDVFKELNELEDLEAFISNITCSHIEISKSILRKKYIENKTNETIAYELNMARRTYFDNLANAHVLAGLLCSKIGSNQGVRKFRTVKE